MYLFHILIILGVYQGLVAQWPDLSVAMAMLLGGIISFPLTLIASAGVYLLSSVPVSRCGVGCTIGETSLPSDYIATFNRFD